MRSVRFVSIWVFIVGLKYGTRKIVRSWIWNDIILQIQAEDFSIPSLSMNISTKYKVNSIYASTLIHLQTYFIEIVMSCEIEICGSRFLAVP